MVMMNTMVVAAVAVHMVIIIIPSILQATAIMNNTIHIIEAVAVAVAMMIIATAGIIMILDGIRDHEAMNNTIMRMITTNTTEEAIDDEAVNEGPLGPTLEGTMNVHVRRNSVPNRSNRHLSRGKVVRRGNQKRTRSMDRMMMTTTTGEVIRMMMMTMTGEVVVIVEARRKIDHPGGAAIVADATEVLAMKDEETGVIVVNDEGVDVTEIVIGVMTGGEDMKIGNGETMKIETERRVAVKVRAAIQAIASERMMRTLPVAVTGIAKKVRNDAVTKGRVELLRTRRGDRADVASGTGLAKIKSGPATHGLLKNLMTEIMAKLMERRRQARIPQWMQVSRAESLSRRKGTG